MVTCHVRDPWTAQTDLDYALQLARQKLAQPTTINYTQEFEKQILPQTIVSTCLNIIAKRGQPWGKQTISMIEHCISTKVLMHLILYYIILYRSIQYTCLYFLSDLISSSQILGDYQGYHWSYRFSIFWLPGRQSFWSELPSGGPTCWDHCISSLCSSSCRKRRLELLEHLWSSKNIYIRSQSYNYMMSLPLQLNHPLQKKDCTKQFHCMFVLESACFIFVQSKRS